ncbi:MAG: cytochrome c3 family protein [ANME-2 cluster archaeon]|nr:cytochrome c3 family protein [ANME-2 cluster archaeon]
MSLKKLIPGALTILTLIFFAIGLITSVTSTIIIDEDCNECHDREFGQSAEIHVEGGLMNRDCTNCHESIEISHGGFELDECDHCHSNDRGIAMAYTKCSNCHKRAPHEDKMSTNECMVCHSKCSTCHHVSQTTVIQGRHENLKCEGCHIYHLYRPQCISCHMNVVGLHENITDVSYSAKTCISCHGPAHNSTYSQINEEVIREYTWHYSEE